MAEVRYQDLDYGITVIDAEFHRPGVAASYLVVEGGRAAFVETGTSLSVPGQLAVLEQKGIPRENVDYVIPTHVHLDHAGGAGELMRHLPAARLVIHPRGARHMIDPSRLIAGAAAVYGEEAIRRHYGEVVPVPAERVLEAGEGDEVDLDGRTLRFLDTPGHALHHFCVVDEAGRGIFTGDTFGISYREFDNEHGAWIFPTTTPVQFDPPALHASIDRLVAQGLDYMYLTHYGRVGGVDRLRRLLHEQIDGMVALGREHAAAGARRQERLIGGLMEQMLAQLERHGCTLPVSRRRELLTMDVELNVQGLEIWLDRKAKTAASA